MKVMLLGSKAEGTIWPPCERALRAMGNETIIFDDDEVFRPFMRSLAGRVVGKITAAPAVHRYSRLLGEFLSSRRDRMLDLVLVCKGQYLTAKTVQAVKDLTQALVFNWQSDDYFSPTLSSRHAVESIPLYDCIFVHARANLPGLVKAGARRAEYLPLGADPALYVPLGARARNDYDRDVVYIGMRREDREDTLARLLSNGSSFHLEIWGKGWDRLSQRSPLRPHVRRPLASWDEYPGLIRRSKISLALLTRFDTGLRVAPLRIFEIPAAGGFLLAERGNGEIAEFFREDEEMVCFGDVAEMRDKIEYFLHHEDERRVIALAGEQRAVRDGYFYTNRIERIIEVYDEIRGRQLSGTSR